MAIARSEMLKRLHAQAAAGRPLVGCGGTGIGQVPPRRAAWNLIIIYNSGALSHGGADRWPGSCPMAT
ncbi:MAG: hypothetical protein R2911_29090 [Caldilineaceae bacterium]